MFTALDKAFKRSGWTYTQLAVAAGISEAGVQKWFRKKQFTANATTYQRLREQLPGFAELIDKQKTPA